jgi:hypothetical protein
VAAGADSEMIRCHDRLFLSRIVKPAVLNCQPFRRELQAISSSSVRHSFYRIAETCVANC